MTLFNSRQRVIPVENCCVQIYAHYYCDIPIKYICIYWFCTQCTHWWVLVNKTESICGQGLIYIYFEMRAIATNIESFNWLRSRQNGRHFADSIGKLLLHENYFILMQISLIFVPNWPNTITGSGNGIALNMRQAIILNNDGLIYWRINASLGLDGSKHVLIERWYKHLLGQYLINNWYFHQSILSWRMCSLLIRQTKLLKRRQMPPLIIISEFGHPIRSQFSESSLVMIMCFQLIVRCWAIV